MEAERLQIDRYRRLGFDGASAAVAAVEGKIRHIEAGKPVSFKGYSVGGRSQGLEPHATYRLESDETVTLVDDDHNEVVDLADWRNR